MTPTHEYRGPSIAFYYGEDPPASQLAAFEQVVVEAENVDADQLRALQQNRGQIFAYLSLGEVDPTRSWYPEVQKEWVLGTNPGWKSAILDPRKEAVQAFVIQRAAMLWKRGYRAFFLDTLDSYQAALADKAQQQACADGLANIIKKLHKQFPGIKLLLNRGFEFLPQVAPLVSGLVAESLFSGWSAEAEQYVRISGEERRWLLARLEQARKRFHLPVTVIEYVPLQQRERARATARLISELGYVPWVSTPPLDTLGVGYLEVLPRRVLVIYDSNEAPLSEADAHIRLGPVLDYLGYAADFVDVQDALPQYPLLHRYAGIISWFNGDNVSASTGYQQWLLRQLEQGVKVAIIGRIGFLPRTRHLKIFGLRQLFKQMAAPIRIEHADKQLMGFEALPRPRSRDISLWRAASDRISHHLRLQDSRGNRLDPVVLGPWGGMALDPFVIAPTFQKSQRWILQPYAFIQRALQLKPIPVPDLTTENGSRLLTIHIDGDGFASRAELPQRPFSGEVILRQVLKHHRLPTTVSIVEGEVGATGLYPRLTRRLEPIARKIFALPFVELASHSYSHPFDWIGAQKAPQQSKYHLPIPQYKTFSLEREIKGSVEYINQRLAPRGKKVRVYLWSGACNPDGKAMAMINELGLYNVNGGNTSATKKNPSLTNVYPAGRPVGRSFQVYAPMINENVYTNLWRGPFYGYQRVIETFQLTGAPRRLKPISIYYHFYSGTKPASLKALQRVYDWALAQQPLPLYLSQYAARAEDWQRMSLARRMDGGLQIHGSGALRTLRLQARWPDLRRSVGVVGVRDLPQGRYVGLAGHRASLLYLTDKPPTTPHLQRANAPVESWHRTGNKLRFRLRGHLPVRLTIAGLSSPCKVIHSASTPQQRYAEGVQHFSFNRPDTGETALQCK